MLDISQFIGPTPPPEFASASGVVSDALPTLTPPRRIDVPTWAAAERKLATPTYTGDWDNSFAPYMREPSRMTTSRLYSTVAFCGPARTVKSDSLILNTFGHRVCCDPRDMLIVAPSQTAAALFSRKKLDPMIRSSPTVRARQLTGRGADNVHDKLFAGGMSVHIGWPVVGQFAMLEYADVLETDYDRMDDDVGGEGSAYLLGLKRTTNYGSRGMTIVESSPSRPILDGDWKPKTPHEAPPTTGILGIFNAGTRGKFYWDCPACHDPFQPLTDRLHWEDRGSPGESASTVEMVCPSCGHCIPPDRKKVLNEAGIWLHEASDGKRILPVDDGDIRATEIVSYWCEGPVAAMQNWRSLVARLLQAREDFKRTGDETSLKSTINVDHGRPYLSAAKKNADESLSEDTLRALAERYPLGIAPEGTRFITVQVDIQGNRFVVQLDAWLPELERYLIDRFEIVLPPEDAPGGARDKAGNAARSLDPGRYFEDWAVLPPLLERVIPVRGTSYGLKPVAQIVDSKGRAGVTANAYRFLRQQKAAGLGNRVFLANGQGGLNRDRARYGAPEKILQKKGRQTTDIRLVYVGTDRLKDEVTLTLTRKDAGPGKYHLSEELPDAVFAELCAEARGTTGWSRKRENLANEALDLAVYGKALVIVLKGERIKWDAAPAWARPVGENAFGVRLGEEGSEETPVAVARPRGRRVRSKGVR